MIFQGENTAFSVPNQPVTLGSGPFGIFCSVAQVWLKSQRISPTSRVCTKATYVPGLCRVVKQARNRPQRTTTLSTGPLANIRIQQENLGVRDLCPFSQTGNSQETDPVQPPTLKNCVVSASGRVMRRHRICLKVSFRFLQDVFGILLLQARKEATGSHSHKQC